MRRSSLFASLAFCQRVAHWVPHPAKVNTGGEDAFLATDYVLGLCDGVSWWAERTKGIASAGVFSELLIKTAHEIIEDDWLGDPSHMFAHEHPSLHILRTSYERTRSTLHRGEAFMRAVLEEQENAKLGLPPSERPATPPNPLVVGTTTAQFVTIGPGFLEVANLGDCECLVVRDGEVLLRTKPQHHDLATPFQLGTGSRDTPDLAEIKRIEPRVGDVVIMATDGIFDNLYERDVVRIVCSRVAEARNRKTMMNIDPDSLLPAKQMTLSHDTETVAQTIATLTPEKFAAFTSDDREALALHVGALQLLRAASLNAFDPKSDTPYASQCINRGAYFEGGKIDDMTVVLAVLHEDHKSKGERFSSSFVVNAAPYKNWP